MKNLNTAEYNPYFGAYINLVKSESLLTALHDSLDSFVDFLAEIPFDKFEYKYLPEKWTIKEIILHITDAERIFQYRALRFARFDKTPLSSFEENDYVPVSKANTRNFDSLVAEFISVRKATISLFENFTQEMLLSKGIVSNNEISVRAIGFIISGHSIHHQNIIRERYL
jgi:DinB superfamily